MHLTSEPLFIQLCSALKIKAVLKIICNGNLFPAAVKERSNDEEELRGVRKEVKRLLEDGNKRGPHSS